MFGITCITEVGFGQECVIKDICGKTALWRRELQKKNLGKKKKQKE